MATETKKASDFDDLIAAFNIPGIGLTPEKDEAKAASPTGRAEYEGENGTRATSHDVEIKMEVDEVDDWIPDSSEKRPEKSKSRRKQNLTQRFDKAEVIIGSTITPMGGWTSNSMTKPRMNPNSVNGKSNLTNGSGGFAIHDRKLIMRESDGQQVQDNSGQFVEPLGGNAMDFSITNSDPPTTSPMVMPVIDRSSIVGGFNGGKVKAKIKYASNFVEAAINSGLAQKGSIVSVVPHSQNSSGSNRQNTTVKAPSVALTKSIVNDVRVLSSKAAGEVIDRNTILLTHVPKPSQETWSEEFDAPPEGFPCQECGSVFLLPASLVMHMQRKSYFMKQPCNFCPGKPKLVFYNKCSFWSHLRRHEAQLGANMVKSVMVRIEPLKVKNITHPDCNEAAAGLVFDCTREFAAKFGVKFPLAESVVTFSEKQETATEKSLQREMLARIEPVNEKTDAMCPGCNKELLKYQSGKGAPLLMDRVRKSHLNAIERPILCTFCNMVVKNNCQLSIHRMIHKEGSDKLPCPECGRVFATRIAYNQHQADSQCVTWAKLPFLRCTSCVARFPNFFCLITHISETHYHSYFKCLYCQLAFQNAMGLLKHCQTTHVTKAPVNITDIPRFRIYQCPLCKNVFGEISFLKAHLKDMHADHIVKNTLEFDEYHCRTCRKSFMKQEWNFYSHMRSVHNIHGFPVFCDICLAVFDSAKDCWYHRSRFHTDKERSGESTAPASTTVYVNSSVMSANGTKGFRFVFECPICLQSVEKKMYYASLEVYHSHFAKVHGGGDPQEPRMVELLNNQNPTTDQNSSPIMVPTSKESSASDKKQDSISVSTKRPVILLGEARKPKVIRRTPMSCAKCDFTCTIRDEFQAHIMKHKVNREHHQCQECGMCFRSNEAVRRHLVMKHRIRDFESYKQRVQFSDLHETKREDKPVEKDILKEKITPAVPSEQPTKATPPKAGDAVPAPPPIASPVPSEPTSSSATLTSIAPSLVPQPNITPHTKPKTPPRAEPPKIEEDLECKVCYKVFATELLLRNHMRSHGMAFIRSKRRSSILS